MYDVIIIGAGPAGSSAAAALAEKGLKTLLVEKCKIPRKKSCSGILIGKSLDFIKRCFAENIPDSAMCRPFENRGMVLTDANGREYRFEQPGLNIRRDVFDGWLVSLAEKRGAEIVDEAHAVLTREEDGFAEVELRGANTYSEAARYVIICCGAAGFAGQREKAPNRIVTYQTFNNGTIDLDPHYFYAYLQKELSEYDAWFNVKDDCIILGTAVKDACKAELLHGRFVGYMEKFHGLKIKEKLYEEKWLMPEILPGCPINCGEGRVFLAGEAAGLLNPMGEGISSALESGRLAAEAIAEYFENPESALKSYALAAEPLRNYMRRQWGLVSGWSDAFAGMSASRNTSNH